MLPAVSSPETLERDMGMTVGIGYVGGLLCLIGLPLILGKLSPGGMFVPMAIVYALFAIPAMFISRDFPRVSRDRFELRSAYKNVAETFRTARANKTIFRFLITDFLYENAVASVITLMGVYCTTVMGFAPAELSAVFGPAIIISALSAFWIFGPLTRKIGPKKAVLVDLSIWLVLFAMALIIRPGTVLDVGSVHLESKALFAYAVAPLAGLGLAGVWTASRVYLTAITPAADAGKIWSLYSLSGRSAAVVGDLTWTLVLSAFGETLFGFQMALLALAGFILLGFISMLFLPDIRAVSTSFTHTPGTATQVS
jgi:UMF1 family MFS transporter